MGGRVRAEHECSASNGRGGLFEHIQPLPHHLEIDEREAPDVTTCMRQGRTEALLDGIVAPHGNDGNGACRLPQRPEDWRCLADDNIRRERHQFCCVRPYAAGVGPTKACLDLDVAAVCPILILEAPASALSLVPVLPDRRPLPSAARSAPRRRPPARAPPAATLLPRRREA